MRWRRWVSGVLVVLVGGVLVGCAPSGEELFERAREVNAGMRAAVAEVQLFFYDGDWEVSHYGEIAESCDAGYMFRSSYATPFTQGWRVSQGSVGAAAEELSVWLDEKGWEGVVYRTYSEGITSVTVSARKPSEFVGDMVVTFSTGVATDSVWVTADSTCERGDVDELTDMMFPETTRGYSSPSWEHPLTPRRFGGGIPNPPYPSDEPNPAPTPAP